MRYEEWLKCRVYISDLRPFWQEFEADSHLAPGELRFKDPVPGYVFVKDGISRLRDNMGYMLVLDGKIYIEAENQQYVGGLLSSTVESDKASRWLWDNWAQFEYGSREPTLRFIYFERDNAEDTYNVIVSERSWKLAVSKAIDDFCRVMSFSSGELDQQDAIQTFSDSNFYEFQGGYLVVVPLG